MARSPVSSKLSFDLRKARKLLKVMGNQASICSLLGERFTPEQLWVMMDIETLSDTKAVVLGELWQRVQTGPVRLTTRELCNALALASQIISLDIHLEDNPAIEVFIDDGPAVKCLSGV